MADQNTITHAGNISTITLPHDSEALQRFRTKLLGEGFAVVADYPTRELLRRKLSPLGWPIALQIDKSESELALQIQMFIPWSWIVGFGVFSLLLCIVPVAITQHLPLGLAGLCMGIVPAIACTKQKFDLSPKARWQGAARRLLGKRMKEWIKGEFGNDIVDRFSA